MNIRENLLSGDVGELARLHGEIYHREQGYGLAFEAYCAAGLAEFVHAYDPARDRVWLAEHHGAIVGSLILAHHDASAQLRFFLVAPAYRGLGLGRDLMERFMVTLAALGYAHALLWTTDDLPTAAALYRRHGFVLTEERPSTRFGKALVEQKYEWGNDAHADR